MTNAPKKLYHHQPHEHKPRNVREVHKQEIEDAGFNQRLAVWITKATSTMVCAYLFTVLSLIGLFGLLGWLNPFVFLLTTWISQQFLQLVFLPILSLGQSVLSRHAELQADEQYACVMKTFADIEQMMKHLDAQDEQLLAILEKLEESDYSPG